ncbi:MAG: hypothetical protein VX498_05505 [Myxococcota bacterium]|nr:hypothetical protein [Myxococcota bacterium]
MSRFALLLVAVVLGGWVLLATSCTEPQKEQAEYKASERKRASAEKAVGERAKLYWDLIRWQDWDRAARFFELPDSQLAFLRDVSGPAIQHPKRENIEIKFVFVSSDQPEEAELRIAWTEVVAVRGSVESRLVSQRWYKRQGTWWIRPDLPFGRVQGSLPDVGEDPEGIDEAPPEDLPTESPGSEEGSSSGTSSEESPAEDQP